MKSGWVSERSTLLWSIQEAFFGIHIPNLATNRANVHFQFEIVPVRPQTRRMADSFAMLPAQIDCSAEEKSEMNDVEENQVAVL